MRVAITGSRGFVGSHIANEAFRRGWLVNHIGSHTKNAAELLNEADAVVHSVGTFMADQRYKQLVSQPVSLCNMAKLASIKLGLSPRSPLDPDLNEINFGTVKKYVDLLKPRNEHTKTPFVFVSAEKWLLSSPEYIASKRKAEAYIAATPYLRPVFLRPGMIAPIDNSSVSCSELTPRHLVDFALSATQNDAKISVNAIAIAACDAIETTDMQGVINSDVLRELDSVVYN